MTVMKKIRFLAKKLIIPSIIFSLIQTSFVFPLKAQSDVLNLANQAVGIYGQILGQQQKSKIQQVNAQKNQALMQSLSPSCRKTDGTSCFTVAGKFFPECPIPASMTSKPQNVCSAASPEPGAISNMITYEAISKSWVNYFDQMQNLASNSATPFGLKCLGDKQKALNSQLTEMVNNLTRLQDQLNKDKEIFKANNKKLLEQMIQDSDELNGAGQRNNLAIKTKDFSKYFSPSCQAVIGDEALAAGARSGFIGLMQNVLSVQNKSAAEYNQNRPLIESDLRRDIEKIQRVIATGGLQDYFDGKNTEVTKFSSLIGATQKQTSEFKIAQERIAKELAKIGYTIPVMDKNFSIDFEDFLAGSKDFFKKQYINDCVTGKDRSGVAISTEQILNSLQQRSTNSRGTARDKYREALKTILDNDSFIEDKLDQIKALENTYKDISITYQNANSQRIVSTPYDLYIKTLESCQIRYNQDDTFKGKGATNVSQQKKVERGQALLREFKVLHDNFASDLGNRALERVLNCDGEAKKAGATCGDKKSFDHTAPTFCMNQANQCANEVQGCYSEANKQIELRKTRLETLAKTFNANAEALVARSNLLYTQQKNTVLDIAKTIQARFPGTNFEIPKDMFISMPELKKDSFGVDMANDGNLSFMDELPKKIDLLKKMFADQQAIANKEIDNYIREQNSAMEKEKGFWRGLATECEQNITTSSRELAKMNNERAKRENEQKDKVGTFCRRYSSLSTHPLGGCDTAKKLSGEVDDIAAYLNTATIKNTLEFNSVCNSLNNQKNEEGKISACDLTTTPNNAKKCEEERARESKNASAKGVAKKIQLRSLCSREGIDDEIFIKKVLAQLPGTKNNDISIENLKKELRSQDSEGEILKTDFPGVGFFSSLKEIIKDQKNENICQVLLNVEKSTPADIDKRIETLEKSRNEASTKDDNEGFRNLGKELEELKEKKEKIKDRKESLANAIAILNDERDDNSAIEKNGDKEALIRIGEQQIPQTSCDVQAGNTNIQKIFNGSLLPQGYDNSRLGTQK